MTLINHKNLTETTRPHTAYNGEFYTLVELNRREYLYNAEEGELQK